MLRLDAERPPEDNARLIMDQLVHPMSRTDRRTSSPQVRYREAPDRGGAPCRRASQVAARPARVVEFVGLPGAGKTTAARWLADRLARTKPRR